MVLPITLRMSIYPTVRLEKRILKQMHQRLERINLTTVNALHRLSTTHFDQEALQQSHRQWFVRQRKIDSNAEIFSTLLLNYHLTKNRFDPKVLNTYSFILSAAY